MTSWKHLPSCFSLVLWNYDFALILVFLLLFQMLSDVPLCKFSQQGYFCWVGPLHFTAILGVTFRYYILNTKTLLKSQWHVLYIFWSILHVLYDLFLCRVILLQVSQQGNLEGLIYSHSDFLWTWLVGQSQCSIEMYVHECLKFLSSAQSDIRDCLAAAMGTWLRSKICLLSCMQTLHFWFKHDQQHRILQCYTYIVSCRMNPQNTSGSLSYLIYWNHWDYAHTYC